MTRDADGRGLLPIACALGPADGAQRLADWRRLGATAGLGRERSSGRVVLRFRGQPDTVSELERLVAAERTCCSFLGWELVPAGDECHVVITGREDELATLSLGFRDPD